MPKAIELLLIGQVLAFCETPLPVSSPKLAYATYVGTGRNSILNGFAVDKDGYAYVGGIGPGIDASTPCAFLTKLDQSGNSAVWSVCLPMAQVDAVALDVSGFIYVAGPSQPTAGMHTSTVMKLTADSQNVIFATQITGTANGVAKIALDPSGGVYIGGQAGSALQTTPGAYSSDSTNATYAAKLNPDGTLVYATYLVLRSVAGIAADSLGQAWVVGSACGDATCAIGKYGTKASILKLDAMGTKVLVTKLFGGGSSGTGLGGYIDSADGIAVDAADNAWVVGGDISLTAPTTASAIQVNSPLPAGIKVGYAIKLSSTGALLYGTYLAEPMGNTISSIVLDGLGNPYMGGNFSLTALTADGSSILLAMDSINANPIALDANGGLYAVEYFCSTTPGAYQPFYLPGNNHACVAKFDLTQNATAQLSFPVNSASLRPGNVAPGELLALLGRNLPPDPQIAFDGAPARVVYADTGRIITVVPFRVPSSLTALTVDGVAGFNLGVWPYAIGLFTADGTGKGQLDARNEDGSINSSDNPAIAGSIVTVFLTGAGAMIPSIGDGVLGPTEPPFPVPVLALEATIDRMPAAVVYASQAPGMVAGIVRAGVQVPRTTAPGNAVVAFSVAGGGQIISPMTTITVR